MHIAVVGTGYVGLVTGTYFSEFSVDVTCVESVTKSAAEHMNGYKVMVNKSTVPVGIGQWVSEQ